MITKNMCAKYDNDVTEKTVHVNNKKLKKFFVSHGACACATSRRAVLLRAEKMREKM